MLNILKSRSAADEIVAAPVIAEAVPVAVSGVMATVATELKFAQIDSALSQEDRETAIHNIASMGRFSTDESIRHYAKEIWNIVPCPPDLAILAKVQAEYAEHDRCKIVGPISG